MKASLHTVNYAGCPNCGNEHAFNLSGVEERRIEKWEWACGECNHVYQGELVDGSWDLTHRGVDTPTLVLLQIPPQEKPIYFVVESSKSYWSAPVGSDEANEHNRFLYEDNSSLTNHIQCETIIAWDPQFGQYDYSPSGLAKYIAEVPAEGVVERPVPDDGKVVAAFAPHNDDMRQLAAHLNLLGE